MPDPSTAKPKARASRPPVPAGYEVRYPHRTYLLVKTGAAKDDPERIKVMCRAHGTVVPAKSVTDADAIAAKPNRPSWCRKCKAEAGGK